MSADHSPSHNRFHPPTWVVWGTVCGAVAAYLLLFFSQPSVIGDGRGAGQPVSRLVDFLQILLWEQRLESMAGYGRFELSVWDRLPSAVGIAVWLGLAAWIGWPFVQRLSRPRSRQAMPDTGGEANAASRLARSARPAADVTAVELTRLEEVAVSVLVGLSLLSTLTLLLGLAGGLGGRVPLAVGVGCLVIAAGVASRGVPLRDWLAVFAPLRRVPNWLRNHLRLESEQERARRPQPKGVDPRSLPAVWLMRLVPVVTCVLAFLMFYGSLMPPWEFDVVEYHLQAPKEYHQAGAIRFNEHNIYANMPLGAEMHSLAAMTLVGGADGWWTGGLIGKGITGSFSLLVAALLGGFVGRRLGTWNGWVAAGTLLATPGNAHVAMAGLIDMVVAAYLLAAVILLIEWWPKLCRPDPPLSGMLLICLLAGTAAACKYTGVVFVTLPIYAALAWGAWQSRNRRTATRAALAMLVGMLLTGFPWYAKNFVWTGNPVFPLATGLFGTGGLDAAQVERWQAAHRVPANGYTPAAAWESLVQVFLTSPFLQPALIVLLLCGVVVTASGLLERAWGRFSRSSSTGPPKGGLPAGDLPAGQLPKQSGGRAAAQWGQAWFWLMLWIGVVWWGATHRIDRFLLPALPLACGLASLGAAWISRRLGLSLAAAIVLLGMAYGVHSMVSGTIGDNRFLVSLRALRTDAGSDDLPGRIIPPIGWANEVLDGDETQLLLIGEARAYDFRMPIVYSTCFDRSLAEEWLRDQSPEQQRSNLHRAGITHVMVNWSELERYRSDGNYGFSDWPQRTDIAGLVESEVLRPVGSPFDSRVVEVFAVDEER